MSNDTSKLAAEWIVTCEDGEDFRPMTQSGVKKLLDLDRSFIGTEDYLGYDHFWSHQYRHDLRDATAYRRRLVHKKLCEENLDPSGTSPEHAAIVLKYVRA